MNHSLLFLKNNKNRIYTIIWLFFISLFFYMAICKEYINYESNDDFFLSTISNGLYGDFYVYMVHNNVVLGTIIAFLNSIFSTINVSLAFSLLLIYISYALLGIWLIYKKEGLGLGLGFLSFLITYETILFRMNYSKTGALLLVISVIVLFDCISKENESRWMLFGSSFLFVTGSLFRYKVTIAFIPFLILFLLIKIIVKKKNGETISATMNLIPLIIAVVAICMCWSIDYIAYNINDEWSYYKEYNDIRERVLDYGVPDYESHVDEYNAIGLTECDVEMLNNWSFFDDNVFGLDVMKKILDMRGSYKVSLNHICTTFNLLYKECHKYVIWSICLIFGVIVVALGGSVDKYAVLLWILMVAEQFYLIWLGNYPERALMTATVFAYFFLLYEIADMDGLNSSRFVILTGFLVFFAIIGGGILNVPSRKAFDTSRRTDVRSFLEYISNDSDNLYAWPIGVASGDLMQTYGEIKGIDNGYLQNSVFTGGWMTPAPIFTQKLEGHGNTRSIFENLIYDDNTYLVGKGDGMEELYLQYLQIHYQSDIKYEIKQEMNGYMIYDYYVE